MLVPATTSSPAWACRALAFDKEMPNERGACQRQGSWPTRNLQDMKKQGSKQILLLLSRFQDSKMEEKTERKWH